MTYQAFCATRESDGSKAEPAPPRRRRKLGWGGIAGLVAGLLILVYAGFILNTFISSQRYRELDQRMSSAFAISYGYGGAIASYRGTDVLLDKRNAHGVYMHIRNANPVIEWKNRDWGADAIVVDLHEGNSILIYPTGTGDEAYVNFIYGEKTYYLKVNDNCQFSKLEQLTSLEGAAVANCPAG